ncbi:MAG: AMP-binding protein [Acidimicrobiia bacterium]
MTSAHVDTFTRDNLPPEDQWPDLIFELPELSYPEQMNCATELLDKAVERGWGERVALIGGDITWTYADLLREANRIARVLVEDLEVVPGNRVLLRSANTPQMVAAWFAIQKAGAVAVATMPLLRAGELKKVIDKAQVSLALCDARMTDELDKSEVPGLTIVPWGGETADDLFALASHKPQEFTNVDTEVTDVSILAFTSGTTGVPKGTMHFHRDILAMADCFPPYVLEATGDDIFTGSPPLAFTFGLGGLAVFPMRIGATTVLVDQPGMEPLLEAIQSHRATVCFTAPVAWRAMVDFKDAFDLSSLRKGVSAGETLPAPTWHSFHDATGIKLIDGIGSTEMLHIFISSSGDDIRPGSTGQEVPGYEAKVVDADGNEVEDGEVGKLAVRGPTGCRYLDDPRQKDYVQNGWNLTGDAYIRDQDGYFWYQARTDDMIITAGYNVAAPEVEGALLSHPAVMETGVVGVPDAERGTVIKAYVVPREGHEPSEELRQKLQDHVKAEIAPYKYPRLVEFMDDLPRTETGKVQRFKLRELS